MRTAGATALLERALWQSYAQVYDGLLEVLTYRDMIGQVSQLADCAGLRVLDAGAGTGNVTRALLQAGAGTVTALDSSGTMVRRARRKLADDLLSGRVTILRGDAVEVMATLPDASADRITAVNVLYALPSRTEFFRQARRLLAPGGFMIAAHTTRPGSGPIIRDQIRRGGVRSILRPRLIGIAGIDLIIDLLAHGGRYDFAPVRTLADEAAAARLSSTTSLGRCYGGKHDGVNELLRFAP